MGEGICIVCVGRPARFVGLVSVARKSQVKSADKDILKEWKGNGNERSEREDSTRLVRIPRTVVYPYRGYSTTTTDSSCRRRVAIIRLGGDVVRLSIDVHYQVGHLGLCLCLGVWSRGVVMVGVGVSTKAVVGSSLFVSLLSVPISVSGTVSRTVSRWSSGGSMRLLVVVMCYNVDASGRNDGCVAVAVLTLASGVMMMMGPRVRVGMGVVMRLGMGGVGVMRRPRVSSSEPKNS